MVIGSYTCWFEVTGLSAGRDWVRFDRTREYESGAQECDGIFVDFDCYRDPLTLAVEELGRYLPDILSAEPVEVTYDDGPEVERRLRWAGVRVRVWDTDDVPDDGAGDARKVACEPLALVQATFEQMATGRLASAASGVLAAQHDMDAARAKLRRQIVAAADDGVGRNHIARVTERALARRLVLQHLVAHDIRRQAERALPKSIADQVLLTVGTGDEVTLRLPHVVVPADLGDTAGLAATQTPADRQAEKAYREALTVAESALAALRSGLLVVRTSDGHEATANYLAAPATGFRPVAVITRHPHAPRGYWEGPTDRPG